MRRAFFLHYTRLMSKKNRLRKLVVTFVCAAAVALTALSAGFLGSFRANQEDMMRLLTANEVFVINKTYPFGDGSSWEVYESQNGQIPEEERVKIEAVDGVDAVNPFLLFTSDYGGKGFAKDDTFEADSIGEPAVITLKGNGEERSVPFQTEESGLMHYYQVIPYRSANTMRLQSESWRIGSNGAYITDTLAKELGLDPDVKPEGYEISFDVWVPGVSYDRTSQFGDASGNLFDLVTNQSVFVKKRLTVKLDGVIRKSDDGGLFGTMLFILLPQEKMEQVLQENRIEMNQFPKNVYELLEYYGEIPEDELTVKEWRPWAYQILVSDAGKIASVKKALAEINPNYLITNDQQDTEAIVEYQDNAADTVLYVALAVLAVVFLLMALIYVYLIDRRKFEFAVLRANGLTKREVRKVVCTEMFFQFAGIFLLSLICAGVIYLVAAKALGYPFVYDGMTVVYALLISLGTVVLPTVISLAFVNKFEPDAVMRN